MIGVFDSGFGGLTILKEFISQKNSLSQYDYIYLGDNARAPYGDKSQKIIYEYTVEAVDFLFNKGCGLIVLACNTASAEALRRIQTQWLPKHYPKRKVLGVVIPVAEEVAAKREIKRIGLIATKATIKSCAYEREVGKLRRSVKFFSTPTPLLVPLVEEGWAQMPETKMVLKRYLAAFKDKKIQAMILGCTHYPLLRSQIKTILGSRIEIIDPPVIVARSLKDYLDRHAEIECSLSKSRKRIYYTTDRSDNFKRRGQGFLGKKIGKVVEVRFE
jgi:glutamate racemase